MEFKLLEDEASIVTLNILYRLNNKKLIANCYKKGSKKDNIKDN